MAKQNACYRNGEISYPRNRNQFECNTQVERA